MGGDEEDVRGVAAAPPAGLKGGWQVLGLARAVSRDGMCGGQGGARGHQGGCRRLGHTAWQVHLPPATVKFRESIESEGLEHTGPVFRKTTGRDLKWMLGARRRLVPCG